MLKTLRVLKPTTLRGWVLLLLVLGSVLGLNAYAANGYVREHDISAHHLRVAGKVIGVETYRGTRDLDVLLADGETVSMPEDGTHRVGDVVVVEVSTQDPTKARLAGSRALSHRGKVIFLLEATFLAVLALLGVVIKVAKPSS